VGLPTLKYFRETYLKEYLDTSPRYSATFRSAGRRRWWGASRRPFCGGPWASGAVAVGGWLSEPTRWPPPGRRAAKRRPRPCYGVECFSVRLTVGRSFPPLLAGLRPLWLG